MSPLAASPLLAQIEAELKMRLRSFATPIALLAFCAAAFLWIPDPRGHSASLTWELRGQIQSPLYTAAYVGLAVSILSAIFLPLGGFYLVAGSVRRDRERGVGAILAATPLSKSAYLCGKFAAHFAYLLVLALFALATGLVAFVRFGAGSFSLARFAGPYLVLTVPVLFVVASLAVLFDVTPGLRGRGGLVIWFFVFLFGLVKLPLDLVGADVDPQERHSMSKPVFDPAGIATDEWIVRRTLPAEATSISTGHVSYANRKIERVPWGGIRVTPELVLMRAANAALSAIPLSLAVLVFDRFDASRRRRRVRGPGILRRLAERFRRRPAAALEAAGEPSAPVVLTPVSPTPSTARAIAAEVRLIWNGASWIKWPLAASAILAGVLPNAMAGAAFLVLLVPVIAEVAAREELSGTRALVFSQPAVPASPILWKASAVALFLLVLGAPLAIRSFFAAPVRGLECILGLLAIAGLSVAFGSLSSGGKLFSGIYLAVWYMAVSGLPAADATGSLTRDPELVVSAAYLGAGAVSIAAALLRERLRAA